MIATKFPPGMRATAEDMPRALEASLARLQRPVVDLYQHHFPAKRVDIPRLMGLMADAVDAGKIRAVGVSNYSAELMRIAHAALAQRGVPLASNQVQYSLLHRQPETNGVLDTCRELGVTLIAYQPLASGALTGKYLAEARPRGLRRLHASLPQEPAGVGRDGGGAPPRDRCRSRHEPGSGRDSMVDRERLRPADPGREERDSGHR